MGQKGVLFTFLPDGGVTFSGIPEDSQYLYAASHSVSSCSLRCRTAEGEYTLMRSGKLLFPGSAVIVYSSGTIPVSSGEVLMEEILSSGGNDRMVVSSGGRIVSVTAAAGGRIFITGGGSAGNITLSSGGYMENSSGGYVSGIKVKSGGEFHLLSGGTALEVASESGAVISVYEGGYIEYI